MRKIDLYTLCTAALLTAAACSDDWSEQAPATTPGEPVRAEAGFGPQTRIVVSDDGTDFNYYWKSGDAFTVFDAQHGQQTLFRIDETNLKENAVTAAFTGKPETAYEVGQKVIAVYNAQGGNEKALPLDANGNLTLDLSGQDGTLKENYQFLYGEATYQESGKLYFSFNHLVTTLRLQITVPDGVTEVKNVRLKGGNLVPKATLVLNKAPHDSENRFQIGDLVYSYTDNNYGNGQVDIAGSFTPVNGQLTLYAYVLDAKLYSDDKTYSSSGFSPIVLMEDQDGRELALSNYYGYRSNLKGGVYELTMNQWIPLVDFENEATASGTVADPYEIANEEQFYSFMMRSKLDIYAPCGYPYASCSYRLTNNLVLDKEVTWYPIDLAPSWYIQNRSGLFDGNGKQISGTLRTHGSNFLGLFGSTRQTTICNLTLDVNLIPESDEYAASYVGTLAGYLYQSVVENCSVRGTIQLSSDANCVGGIVGMITRGTEIRASGYSGKIQAESSVSRIGGLVGAIDNNDAAYPNAIIGCYSEGEIVLNENRNRYGTHQMGGIIGWASGSDTSSESVSYSWSSMTIPSVPSEGYDWIRGGIAGECPYYRMTQCYWQSSESTPIDIYGKAEPAPTMVDCASFEGAMPTPEQFQQLNAKLLDMGYMFDTATGHIKTLSGTNVPPSDIVDW